MPRPRKPTNVLNLTGAFRKNPQRLRSRANEPKDDRDIGKPPRGISKEVRAAWREIVECAVPGVLCRSDRPALLAAAQLFARMKEQRGDDGRRRGQIVDTIEALDLGDPDALRSTLVDIIEFADRRPAWRPSDQANFTQLLARMGLTPADRSRIIIPEPPTANPFDED